MSVEEPESYGEGYWSTWMEARKYRDEEDGEEFKDYIPNMFGTGEMQALIPKDFLTKWNALIRNPSTGLAGVGGGFVAGVGGDIAARALDPALLKFTQAANRTFPDRYISVGEAAMLKRRNWITPDVYTERLRSAGFNDWEESLVYAGTAPQISIPDWIRWARFQVGQPGIYGQLFEKVDLDRRDFATWEWLGRQQLSTDQLLQLYKRDLGTPDPPFQALEKIGWTTENQAAVLDLAYTIPNAMLLIQGGLMTEAGPEDLLKVIPRGDIHPDYAQTYLDAVLTKPAAFDLVRYELRQDNRLSDLPKQLRKIGVHPDYFRFYEQMAFPIPPVADLVTMAVREAFSPGVASRFGQYEDFPDEFAKYAEMQGVSEEWAKRYWASHWALPSVTQGFEMLHRGVIDKGDMELLLRSQDVMPYWRDRLTEIAYRPLSRVDVRRMFKEGVLSEQEVMQSYLDQGYNDENAERMTEYTIAATLSSVSKFTSSDILKAFTSGVIKSGVASSLLRQVGVRSKDVSTVMNFAEYKRDWDYTNDRIAAIGNLMRKDVYTAQQAQSELGRLNLPSDQIEVQMDRWYSEAKEKAPITWTKAETLKFIKSKTITLKRGQQELERIGYDDEHIAAYMTLIEE